MKHICFLLVCLILLSVFIDSAVAGDCEYQRYNVREIEQHYPSAPSKFLVIDNDTGHMWIFETTLPMSDKPKQSYVTRLLYQGKLTPAKKSNTVIFKNLIE